MTDVYERQTCRLCDASSLTTVLELTPTPPGNRVLTEAETRLPAPSFPLELRFCTTCCHVQLGHVVAPEILYRDHYSYVTGTSPVFVAHFKDYADFIVPKAALKAGDLVVDIGSNDGTGLSFFKQRGLRVLGVDPASEIAHRATENGIETIDAFFGVDLAHKLRREYGAARLVSSHNACAHIDDLGGVIDGARELLADDGLFVMEVGYFVDVFSNLWFDTIYHEHLDYHTVAPLLGFFRRHGMEVVGVQRIAPQGGSIRVIVQRVGGPHEVDGSIAELVGLEQQLGLDKAETLRSMGTRLESTKRRLLALLGDLRLQGHTIAGYGAPTKSTTLMLHFGLGRELIDFIVDDNPLKQGFFTPATFVPIGAATLLDERNPDYVLILAWNFAEPIMRKHSRFAGRFVIPMPEPRIT